MSFFSKLFGGVKKFSENEIVDVLSTVFLGAPLSQIPRNRIQAELIRFGKAFGPQGLRHFSELSQVEQQDLLNRVPVLRTNHTDWVKPLQWVPRTWSTWIGDGMPTPAMTLGDSYVSAKSIKEDGTLLPIPACGDHYVLDGFMSSTWKVPMSNKCVHSRIGWRHDDVDGYYSLDITMKEMAQ